MGWDLGVIVRGDELRVMVRGDGLGVYDLSLWLAVCVSVRPFH